MSVVASILFSPYLGAQESKKKVDIEVYIKNNEGLRLKAYPDNGHISIGYGRNLTSVGITRKMAQAMLEEDISKCRDSLAEHFPWYLERKYEVEVVMMDMCYGLGFWGLKKFKKMIGAIYSKQYILAAVELLDSKYARELPLRSQRNAFLLTRGE